MFFLMSPMHIEIEMIDPNSDYVRHMSTNSWVKQMAELVRLYMRGADASVTDIGSASETVDASAPTVTPFTIANGSTGITTHGLICGSSSTTPTEDDVAINTAIASGTGSGELEYQATTVTRTAIAGGYRVSISRQVDNNSGGNVTVEEVGVYTRCYNTGGSPKYFMILHDLTGGETIPDGESRIFKYNLDFTA